MTDAKTELRTLDESKLDLIKALLKSGADVELVSMSVSVNVKVIELIAE